jgi:hypothetical protein
MENQHSSTSPSLFDMNVDDYGIRMLGKAAKWARFIGIFWMVVLALMVVASLMASSFLANQLSSIETMAPYAGFFRNGGPIIVVIAIVFAGIAVIPAIFLFNFGNNMQKAVLYSDGQAFEKAFTALKVCFIILAIFGIIGALSGLYELFTVEPPTKFYNY